MLLIIVGSQYGGEGKGKITAYLAFRDNVDYVVRCGGPNSGHTVYRRGQVYKLRLLPAGFVNSGSRLLFGCRGQSSILIFSEAEIELSGI